MGLKTHLRHTLAAVLVLVLLAAALPAVAQQGPRAFLGINLESTEDGALIDEVIAGSAAEAAGLQAGDLITGWDGEPINLETTLSDYIVRNSPGDTVTLTVDRGGEILTLTATLGTHPDDQVAPQTVILPAGVERGLRMNLAGMDMLFTGDLLVVFAVPEDSAASDVLAAGDRITAIDGAAISDMGFVSITHRLLRGGLVTLDVVQRDSTATRLLLDAPSDRFSLMEMTIIDVARLIEEGTP